MEAAEATPLHLALKQKQFAHVKIMLRLKYDDGKLPFFILSHFCSSNV